ncbi:uncharacterized protein SAPINGB_P002490 [Magnusiomyces paraingens]|uniref:Transposase domain-containing protein n=1 Tax=Magnusiomyces paraingens TaxID=2606893 RepID=A0A5E8BG98_9ASCO|nr:uncharacterized protein SAPINGB_P002490 [Saprochaete ingens]VVT49881.1 unnamed protein product [Saprochaete ingens]
MNGNTQQQQPPSAFPENPEQPLLTPLPGYPVGSVLDGSPLVPPFGVSTGFYSAKARALQYFDPHVNPEGSRYVKLYYHLFYRKNLTRRVFHDILDQMGFKNVAEHERQINHFLRAIRASSDPTGDGAPEILNRMFSTQVKRVAVCENFCIAYTYGDFKEGAQIPKYSCPRCFSERVSWLEYLSPRLIISHMMGSAQMSRMIKTAPFVCPESYQFTNFFTENALRLKKMGILNSPYDLLFALIVDDSNSFVTDDVELIQINLVLLNLPPSERAKQENTFPVFFIPKETKKGERVIAHTYYQTIVDDFKALGNEGMWVYDAEIEKWVVIRAFLGFVSGDLISSSLQMGYANFFGGDCPCKVCGLKRFFLKNITSTHYSGFFSFHLINYQLVRTQAFTKNLEWYNRVCSQYPFDEQNWKFPDQLCKEYGITDKNVFLELPNISLPDSFPFDVMSISLDGVLRTIMNLLFGGPSCYERLEPKYSWSEIAKTRVREVVGWINISKTWGFSDEDLFVADNVINGTVNSFKFGQLREFFELFSIFYFEIFRGRDIEDKLLLELNILRRIAASRKLTSRTVDFLKASFENVIKNLEIVITRNYSVTKNATIFTLYIHLVVHITEAITKCGDLSAFVSPERDKYTRLMRGYNRPCSHYIRAIMNYRTKAIAVQALNEAIFTFSIGHCSFEMELDTFPPLEQQRAWSTSSMKNPLRGDQTYVLKTFLQINRLVWNYFNRGDSLIPDIERLCVIGANGIPVSFPQEHTIFLLPEDCRRFQFIQFASLDKQIPNGFILRLESRAGQQPWYVYAREYIRVTVHICDLNGQNVRAVTRDFVLFTNLSCLERKIEKTASLCTELIFPPSYDVTEADRDKTYVNYGYYYKIPFTSETRQQLKTSHAIGMFAPLEETWGLVPLEQVSNPVYSFAVVDENDKDMINVHLYDPRLECTVFVDKKEVFIDGNVGEFNINAEYHNAMNATV